MSFLDTINSPDDVKKLSQNQLPELAYEIRQKIIDVTSQKGGHVSPNLGVVELSIALHRVFNTPKDKILFDVSHQCYTHKLLTGRNKDFDMLRQSGGISGFCNRGESVHDAFGAGHAGTAASAALGLAAARDKLGTDENVVAVLGDAAFTNGITLEAFNNIANTTKKMIIVLNDNKMSISKNVGAIAQYFNNVITNPTYNRLYADMNAFLKKLPMGQTMASVAEKVASDAKSFILPSSLFEYFGLTYLGPIDGHDIPLLEKYLNFCKQSNRPILLHILTKKGNGLEVAVRNPEKFHGATPYNVVTGESLAGSDKSIPNYQDAMGQALVRFAKKDPKIVGITAAMAAGTGLAFLKKELPNQFFDVGIAEEHAAVFAAGMACQGMKTVTAIYSTFMQRAYDCAMHDICLQKLPATFCLDRAGLSPNDGATHHGLYDISFLRPLPNAVLMQPSNEDELCDMLYTSIESGKPCFIRYPRGKGEGVAIKEEPQILEIGKAQKLRESDGKICIWALGNMVKEANKAADAIKENFGIDVGVVNARFVKPLDTEMLLADADKNKLIVTMEDHVVSGGFGSAVVEALIASDKNIPVQLIGWPDEFVSHGTDVKILRQQYNLDTPQIIERIAQKAKKLSLI